MQLPLTPFDDASIGCYLDDGP